MSLDSDTSPQAYNRDWFFPATSPFFPPSSSGTANHGLNTRRKPSTFPATERAPKPYLREARQQQQMFPTSGTWISSGSSASTSPATLAASEPPATIPRGDPRYAGLRRKVCFDTREEKGERQGGGAVVTMSNELVVGALSRGRRKGFWGRLVDRRMRVRLSLAISTALVLLGFTFILQKNLSLNKQVNLLQDQLSKQKARLQQCDLYDPEYYSEAVPPKTNNLLQKSLKNSALFASLIVLCFPLVILRHLDKISRFQKSSDSKEISLNKQLAYKVDVFLSVYLFSKPLTLLLSTLLLLCLGGLALFGVTDGTLVDSMWLSWTYVADSGKPCKFYWRWSQTSFYFYNFWRDAYICHDAWASF